MAESSLSKNPFSQFSSDDQESIKQQLLKAKESGKLNPAQLQSVDSALNSFPQKEGIVSSTWNTVNTPVADLLFSPGVTETFLLGDDVDQRIQMMEADRLHKTSLGQETTLEDKANHYFLNAGKRASNVAASLTSPLSLALMGMGAIANVAKSAVAARTADAANAARTAEALATGEGALTGTTSALSAEATTAYKQALQQLNRAQSVEGLISPMQKASGLGLSTQGAATTYQSGAAQQAWREGSLDPLTDEHFLSGLATVAGGVAMTRGAKSLPESKVNRPVEVTSPYKSLSADGIAETTTDAFRTPQPEGVLNLHLNPLKPILDAYTKNIGEPAWKLGRDLFLKASPEFVKRNFLISRYGQPKEYVDAARNRLTAISEGSEKAIDLGNRLSAKLTQAEQQKLGKVIKGEMSDADAQLLSNDPRMADAVEAAKLARSELDSLGGQAVAQGLLLEESFFRNYGKYMPRLYRQYEVDFEVLAKKFGEKAPSRLDLQRFKQRKDIPEEVRLMMGEIEEPAFPVAKGISQLTTDVETTKLFNKVAANPEWFLPDQDSLLASGQPENSFVRLPETLKLGKLSGGYVNKFIADDLNQIVRKRSEAEKVGSALVAEWKFGKVVANPPTHVRNLMSNAVLSYLGGLPPTRLDIYVKGLRELQTKGTHFQEARKAGLTNSSFSHAEIAPLLDSWNMSRGSLFERLARTGELLREGKYSDAINKLRPSQTALGQKATNLYQLEENWFKLSKYIHNREKGMTPVESAADAQKWLFNYSEVPKFIDWARQSPIGSPFITFTHKAIPVILESAVKYPWRVGSIMLLINELQKQSENQLELSDGEKKRVDSALPERMKAGVGAPNFVLLPYKDQKGRLQYYDLTYVLPWGDLSESGISGLPNVTPGLSSPVAPLFEVGLNKTRLGGQVYQDSNSTNEKIQKSATHLYQQAFPSLAPGGYGFNKIVKSIRSGEDVPQVLASTLAGQKVSSVDVAREQYFRNLEVRKAVQELNQQAGKIQRDTSLNPKQKKQRLREIQIKIQSIHRP